MRKRSSNRTNSTPKRQPKASKVSNTSVEIDKVELLGGTVTIEFATIADAKKFYAEFLLQMEVDTFLDDMPEEEYGDGVLRTLKVKK